MPEPPVIAPSGELDLASVGRFRSTVDRAARDSGGGLVIDLSGLSFIDSTGLGALIEMHERFRREQRDLCVVAPEGSIAARLLARTGVTGRLHIFASPAQALGHLGGEAGARSGEGAA